jgi:hypothetical protein
MLRTTLFLYTWCSLSMGHPDPEHDLVQNHGTILSGVVRFKCSQTSSNEHTGQHLRWTMYSLDNKRSYALADIVIQNNYLTKMNTTRVTIPGGGVNLPERAMAVYSLGFNHDLEIYNAQKGHVGVYTCSVNGNIHSQGNLVLITAFTCHEKFLPVIEGQYADLNCKAVVSGYKAPSLRWKHSGVTLNQTQRVHGEVNTTRSFQVTSVASVLVTKELHGSTFICDLYYEQETDPNMKASPGTKLWCSRVIEVLSMPTNMRILGEAAKTGHAVAGDEVICESDGDPKPQYYWYLKWDSARRVSGARFIMPNITGNEDSMTLFLVCEARRGFTGSDVQKKEITITVHKTKATVPVAFLPPEVSLDKPYANDVELDLDDTELDKADLDSTTPWSPITRNVNPNPNADQTRFIPIIAGSVGALFFLLSVATGAITVYIIRNRRRLNQDNNALLQTEEGKKGRTYAKKKVPTDMKGKLDI